MKAKSTVISFTAGTGFGVFICATALSFVIKHNKESFKSFAHNVITKALYGERSYTSRSHIRYADSNRRSN